MSEENKVLIGKELIEKLKNEFGKRYLFCVNGVSFTGILKRSEKIGQVVFFDTDVVSFYVSKGREYFYKKEGNRISLSEV